MYDFQELLNEGFHEKRIKAIDDLLRYCRHLQKEHVESVKTDTVSGESVLLSMVQDGSLKLSLYIQLLPAVTYYKTPYNLIENEDSKEKT